MNRTPLLAKLLPLLAAAALVWAPPGPAAAGSQSSKPVNKPGATGPNQGPGNPIKPVPMDLAQPPVTANPGTGVSVPGGSLQVIPGEGLKAPDGSLLNPSAAAPVVPQLSPVLTQDNLSNAPPGTGAGNTQGPNLNAVKGVAGKVDAAQEALGQGKAGAAKEKVDGVFTGSRDQEEGVEALNLVEEQAAQEGSGGRFLPEISEEIPGQKGLPKERDPPYIEAKKALLTVILSGFGIAQPAPFLERLASLARKVARLNRENIETDQYHGFSHQSGEASVSSLFLRTAPALIREGAIKKPAAMSDKKFRELMTEAMLLAAMAAEAHDAEGVEVVVPKTKSGRSYIPIKPEKDRDPSKPEGKVSLGKLATMKPVAKLYEDGQGAVYLYPKIPDTRSHLGNALALIEGRGPEAPGYLEEADHPFLKYVMLEATAFSDEEKDLRDGRRKRLQRDMAARYGDDYEFMLQVAGILAAQVGSADMLQPYAQHRGALLRSFKLQREFRDKNKVVIHKAIGFLDNVVASQQVHQDLYKRLAPTAREDPFQSKEGALRAALYLRILAEKGLVPEDLHELMEIHGEARLGKALEPRLSELESRLDRDPGVRALREKLAAWLALPLDKAPGLREAMDRIMGRGADRIDLSRLDVSGLRISREELLLAMGPVGPR